MDHVHVILMQKWRQNGFTGVTKDANSSQDTVHFSSTKSGWLPSKKYTECVIRRV